MAKKKKQLYKYKVVNVRGTTTRYSVQKRYGGEVVNIKPIPNTKKLQLTIRKKYRGKK